MLAHSSLQSQETGSAPLLSSSLRVPASPTGGPATGKPVQTGYTLHRGQEKSFCGTLLSDSLLTQLVPKKDQERKSELVLSLPCGCGVTTVRARFKMNSSVSFHLQIPGARLPG